MQVLDNYSKTDALEVEQLFQESTALLAFALIAAPIITIVISALLWGRGRRGALEFCRAPLDQAKRPYIADNSRSRLRYDL